MRQYGESISKSKRCWNDVSQQGISKHSQTRRQFFYLQEIKQNQIRGRRNRASRWFYCTWERVWKEGDARRLKKKPIEVFNYREEPSLAVSEPGRGQRFSSAITLRSTAARIFPGINASGYPARGKEGDSYTRPSKSFVSSRLINQQNEKFSIIQLFNFNPIEDFSKYRREGETVIGRENCKTFCSWWTSIFRS